MSRPWVVAVVGRKKSGKTTTVVGLVRELVRRGYDVATAKHGHHFDLDREGRDSHRHRAEGGARASFLSGPEGFAFVGTWSHDEVGLEALVARHLGGFDIVVAEGHKQAAVPRFEVIREAAGHEPIYGTPHQGDAPYLGILTDMEGFRAEVPVLDLNDPDRFRLMADLIERYFGGGSD